jgi:hypothetical protein
MVTPFYAGASAPRNLACAPHAASLLPASAGAPPVPPGSGPTAVHPGLIEHPDLTPEVQVALLAAVDEAVIAELGDLACVIPDHPRPISAVLALVDAGLLALDLQAGFDASLSVWRPTV